MLYIFGGLPGTGKSTLAAELARRFSAFYIRIDTIEQAIRDGGLTVDGPVGYLVGYGLALDNLRLGATVVADSVNPLEITRKAWRDVAQRAQVAFWDIEVICSDRSEHRSRIESRKVDVPGLRLPDWNSVLNREYEDWTTEHVVIDTAGRTVNESIVDILRILNNQRPSLLT